MWLFTLEKQAIVRKDAVVAARIPQTLKDLITKFLAMDAHLNESDFVRDAVREKIRRDAPQLYNQLFQDLELGANDQAETS